MRWSSILTVLVGAGVTYAGLVGFLYLCQRSLLFLPDRSHPDFARVGLAGTEEVSLATTDGLRLIAWYRPPAPGRPTVLYFHGNGGQIGHRAARARLFGQAGYGFLFPEYRGYADNPGSPDEAGFGMDAEAALAFLANRNVAPAQIVLYGESLGSAVAVRLAAETAGRGMPFAALILESPFTSIADVAQHHYFWLPARRLVKDKFDSASRIREVGAPLLMLHGESDRVVPIEFGRALFEKAAEPKRAWIAAGADHISIFDEAAFSAMNAFIREHIR
jgi:fermentation-respiration switch protein FrsA (DUF1100 family)